MIKVTDITKIYNPKDKSRHTALDGISFEVKKGEIISVVGETGSGKTTLANILLGITKINSGNITIDDIEIDSKSKSRKLRKITDVLLLTFQYPDHQLFSPTVKEEILFGNNGKESEMNELFELFSLDKSILDKSPYKISSGQKRKVLLISILLKQPKILILDEATAFLDPRSRKEFIEIIKKINEKYNTTILFISHNIEDVKSISTKTLLLNKGNQVMFDDTEKVMDKYIRGDYNE